MDTKNRIVVKVNGKKFEAKRLGAQQFIPLSYTDNKVPDRGFVDFVVQKLAQAIAERMLEDGAIKVEVGPEFDLETHEMTGYLVVAKSCNILFPIKYDE